MKPHHNNACSGKYHDWLEVMLLPECNGSCSWCIEKGGWHPSTRADWRTIVRSVVESGKQHVMLLGGEPTLYPDIRSIVGGLADVGKSVYLTTNGSMLSGQFVVDNLPGLRGINVSIHSPHLGHNRRITGIDLRMEQLREAVAVLHCGGTSVRLNCNCIRGCVDSWWKCVRYIEKLALPLGADSVRFAELKVETGDFVNLTDIFRYKVGVTDDPYSRGCSIDSDICGFPINLRLMCGLQTPHRPKPQCPEQTLHGVLYYDGNIYDSWQRRPEMKKDQAWLKRLLDAVSTGTVTAKYAMTEITTRSNELVNADERSQTTPDESTEESIGGCHY